MIFIDELRKSKHSISYGFILLRSIEKSETNLFDYFKV